MLTVIDQVRPWFSWVLGVPVPFALAYAPSWGWIVAAKRAARRRSRRPLP
ncbi:hypothetical protein [Streptomyces sp. NPDC023588]